MLFCFDVNDQIYEVIYFFQHIYNLIAINLIHHKSPDLIW